jgi:hypothetical protein
MLHIPALQGGARSCGEELSKAECTDASLLAPLTAVVVCDKSAISFRHWQKEL